MEIATHINSAAGLVRRADGRILLIRNPRRGWEFPGGVIERGESPIDALKREIIEETGITVKPTAFVGAYANLTIKEGYGPLAGTMLPPRLNLAFICDMAGGEVKTSDESIVVEWVTPQEALSRVTHPTVAMRLNDMLSYAGTPVFRSYTVEKDGTTTWLEEVRLGL